MLSLFVHLSIIQLSLLYTKIFPELPECPTRINIVTNSQINRSSIYPIGYFILLGQDIYFCPEQPDLPRSIHRLSLDSDRTYFISRATGPALLSRSNVRLRTSNWYSSISNWYWYLIIIKLLNRTRTYRFYNWYQLSYFELILYGYSDSRVRFQH